jgi:hypothetical protein
MQSGESPNLRPEPSPGRSGEDMNEYTPRQCLVLGPSQDEEGEMRTRVINLNRQLHEKERQLAALPSSEHSEGKHEQLSNAILVLKAALRDATSLQQAGTGAGASSTESGRLMPPSDSPRKTQEEQDLIQEQARLAMWQNSSPQTQRIRPGLEPLSPRSRRSMPHGSSGRPSVPVHAERGLSAQAPFLLPSAPVIVSKHAMAPRFSSVPLHASPAKDEGLRGTAPTPGDAGAGDRDVGQGRTAELELRLARQELAARDLQLGTKAEKSHL